MHAGRGVDPATGAVTPPIHLSTTCVVGLEHPDDLTDDLARALGPRSGRQSGADAGAEGPNAQHVASERKWRLGSCG